MSYFEEYLKKTSKTPIVEVVDPKQTLGKPLVMEKEKTKEIEIPEEPIKKEEVQEEEVKKDTLDVMFTIPKFLE